MILSLADLLNLMSFWCWDLVLGFWLTICFSISLGGGEWTVIVIIVVVVVIIVVVILLPD